MEAKGTIKSVGFMFIFTLITTMDTFEAASRERISQSWSHVVGGESFPHQATVHCRVGYAGNQDRTAGPRNESIYKQDSLPNMKHTSANVFQGNSHQNH